ncbi:acyl-CoA dehydrogenase [Brevibacterium sp. 5221]|uniref:Acyl-CoA dehydrogenase n=1 Tax=Brevibacterium rongguiense TaxID=2695267 RepID=A0A6N9H6J8_9MICO|nr:acyl-CoA dehydrogenase [Brevibacterium rongguiense]MYM19579.1 acyl-CoA dehydrogenase [Brevibacterium rongguiense]
MNPLLLIPGTSPQDRGAVADAFAQARAAAAAPDPIGAALAAADAWAGDLPLPGSSATALRWSALAAIGAADLTVARAAEPHLDARAILAEALTGGAGSPNPASPSPTGIDVDAGTAARWAVYAAEAPGLRVEAAQGADGAWSLTGTKPWCSLADRASAALITAAYPDGRRGLFAVDLGQPGVTVGDASAWQPHGLAAITTAEVRLDSAPALPVGGPGWYLERPGFAWGGVGVAAIWYGGAVAIAERAFRHFSGREPDQVAALHAGRLDLVLRAARAALGEAAAAADTPADDGSEARGTWALRARSAVAQAADEVIALADHAMGPAPLALDREHLTRVSDLRLYVRQHHAERDVAALGRALIAARRDPAATTGSTGADAPRAAADGQRAEAGGR